MLHYNLLGPETYNSHANTPPKNDIYPSLMIVFVSANSAGPEKLHHFEEINLFLQCKCTHFAVFCLQRVNVSANESMRVCTYQI